MPVRILLAHTPDMRQNYYGERALAGLRALGDVVLHEGAEPLGGERLAKAAKGGVLILSKAIRSALSSRITRGASMVETA